MPHPIIVDAAEEIACPKCSHFFPLSEGISRQAIERHAEAFGRSLEAHKRKLAAEAAEALAAKDSVLQKWRRGARAPAPAARARGGEEERRRRLPAKAG